MRLRQARVQCRQDVPLTEVTTFRLGGPTPLLIDCESADELIVTVKLLAECALPYVLIGGGSNLLAADAGLSRAVVRYLRPTPQLAFDGTCVEVSGCSSFDDLARLCSERGLGEAVLGSGIPGTVGGAIVGNAGAFGWQIGDSVLAVRLLGRDGTVRECPASDVTFSYRHSSLKESQEIVLSATLCFPLAEAAQMQAERQRILALRKEKHPDLAHDGCAGSFFRNVEPTSRAERRQAAGWFLEQVGAKEMQVGGAGVFSRHANIIVKRTRDCTAADVRALAEKMARAVEERFGLTLVREVELLGME